MFSADVTDDKGWSPLDRALQCGHVDVLFFLLNLGYGDDKQRAKLLFYASFHGKLDVVRVLVEQHKVDPGNYKCVFRQIITLPLS